MAKPRVTDAPTASRDPGLATPEATPEVRHFLNGKAVSGKMVRRHGPQGEPGYIQGGKNDIIGTRG